MPNSRYQFNGGGLKMANIQNRTADSRKADVNNDTNGAITKKAFELYVKRGKRAGHAIDDWLEAERLLKHKARS